MCSFFLSFFPNDERKTSRRSSEEGKEDDRIGAHPNNSYHAFSLNIKLLRLTIFIPKGSNLCVHHLTPTVKFIVLTETVNKLIPRVFVSSDVENIDVFFFPSNGACVLGNYRGLIRTAKRKENKINGSFLSRGTVSTVYYIARGMRVHLWKF